MTYFVLATRAKSHPKIVFVVAWPKCSISRFEEQVNENRINEVVDLLIQIHINFLKEFKRVLKGIEDLLPILLQKQILLIT